MKVFAIDRGWHSVLFVVYHNKFLQYGLNEVFVPDHNIVDRVRRDFLWPDGHGSIEPDEIDARLQDMATHPREPGTVRSIEWKSLSSLYRYVLIAHMKRFHYSKEPADRDFLDSVLTSISRVVQVMGRTQRIEDDRQRSQLQRLYSNRRTLGKLVGQAVRNEKDVDLYEICSICNELDDGVRLTNKISALGIGLTKATCGHLELEIELQHIANHRGSVVDTACRTCSEDGDVVAYCVDDGLHHWRDDVYYWESDDEYHLREEPEDEDDETSWNDPDARLEYDTDVMRFLSKDTSFCSSAHGDFHMGIELETSYGNANIDSKVAQVRSELGTDYLVCKYDGSVGGQSMEWVTRPTNLKTHIEKFGGWKSTDGLIAWNNRSCGMHVHIDSKAFTALTLGKMIQFYNSPRNDSFIRSVAGRHPRQDHQAAEYAALDSSTVVYSPNAALKGKDPNRYRMINCENLDSNECARLGMKGRYGISNTVEIRIFRASLKKERLLAQIEFAHAAVMFCRVTSYRDLQQEHFMDWLRSSSGVYPNLCKWFGINHRHGKTATKTDSLTNANADTQPELFAEAF